MLMFEIAFGCIVLGLCGGRLAGDAGRADGCCGRWGFSSWRARR
jgi:hypothetical protein